MAVRLHSEYHSQSSLLFMASLWFFIFFSSFASSFSSTSPPKNMESNKYIVQMSNDLKPSVFPEVEHWYQSTLASLTSNLLNSKGSQRTDPIHVYKTVFHGFAAELTPEQVELLESRPEVLAVYSNKNFQLQTTRSPAFLGLVNSNVIGSPLGLMKDSDYGSNVVIGVIDTGVWPESDSYQDDGLDSVPSHFKGECVEGENFTKAHCNNKLVGARYFSSEYLRGSGYKSARDSEGHGTHTSSTAAGREVLNVSMFGYAPGSASGIVHKTRIAVYKACWPEGIGCSTTDLLAAYDKAVEDGVDIISFSIGPSNNLPYHLDPMAIAQFGAIEHNVFVSASAGNAGPSLGSVCNVAPWITTVGAGTMDRTFPADLVLEDGPIITGVTLYSGPSLPEKSSFPLYYPGNLTKSVGQSDSHALCMPGYLDPKHVRGKIVVCEKGYIQRAMKGEVVKNASGVGMVLVNTGDFGESLIADAHVLPALTITASSAKKVFSYLTKSKNPAATIIFRGTELNVKPAPMVAGFSSRGPNTISENIIKPDLIAPGANILAAWPDVVSPSMLPSDKRQTKFNIISGTSMSCPHISGVAALIKGAHPDWSPSRIKSALMTTSYILDNTGQQLLDESTMNTSSAWGYGSGHVDPEKASDPGLVYDLTVHDYIDFLCASNYSEQEITVITRSKPAKCAKELQPWDINYPSIAVRFNQTDSLKYEVTVKRTVTQVSEGVSSYSVETEVPSEISLIVDPPKLKFSKKEQTLSYVVKISATRFNLPKHKGKTVFGRITWQDGKHSVSMPIAVTQFNAGV